MSEESTTPDLLRLARQAYEAASRGDLDAVMSLYAADAAGFAAGRNIGSRWRSFSISGTVSCSASFGRAGRLVGGSGRVEHEVAHLATFANGKIEWQKAYFDVDAARAAAKRLADERG